MAKQKTIPMAKGIPPSVEDFYEMEAKHLKLLFNSYLKQGFSTDQSFLLLLKYLDAAVAMKCFYSQQKA